MYKKPQEYGGRQKALLEGIERRPQPRLAVAVGPCRPQEFVPGERATDIRGN